MMSDHNNEKHQPSQPTRCTKVWVAVSIIGIFIMFNLNTVYIINLFGYISFAVGCFAAVMQERNTEYRRWPLMVIGIGMLVSLVISMIRDVK